VNSKARVARRMLIIDDRVFDGFWCRTSDSHAVDVIGMTAR
jgi:hypothetical protein